MGNRFFDAGEARAVKVNELFDKIAPRYDLVNDLQSFGLHRLWKQQVIRIADVQPGCLALDVCCGTGDLAWALARRGAQVTGVDFSEAMLKVAFTRGRRTRIDSSSAPANPTFIKADAQQLPFADNSFDIATVGYGLRNLASWEKGLFEMQRVLRPGGRLVALEFGKPDNRLWRTLYFAYLKLCVPVLGKLFCGDADAYAYILESLSHYPAQRGVAEKMCGLGLEEVRIVNLLGGVMSINFAKKSVCKSG